MSRTDKLRRQLDLAEDDYCILLSKELEQGLAGGVEPYLLSKINPSYIAGEGRRFWTDEAETLVRLEKEIIALREKLDGTLAGSAVQIVREYVAGMQATREAFPKIRVKAEELLRLLRGRRPR